VFEQATCWRRSRELAGYLKDGRMKSKADIGKGLNTFQIADA
jgi:hypothetical protein